MALTENERTELESSLKARVTEIRNFVAANREGIPVFGSVEIALSREINRLLDLADRITQGAT